jgi:hypothetical protein
MADNLAVGAGRLEKAPERVEALARIEDDGLAARRVRLDLPDRAHHLTERAVRELLPAGFGAHLGDDSRVMSFYLRTTAMLDS